MAHAASAFYVSGYNKSAILTIDGWGDSGTTMIATGHGTRIDKLLEVPYPHSLGGLYSAITEYLGFRSNSDEYKVMGMAAYGQPEYYDFFKDLIQFTNKGGFRLNMEYLSYHTHGHRKWYSDNLVKKLGPARQYKDELTARHKNIAASIQKAVEDAIVTLAKTAQQLTGSKRLCYAGGVALNCLANRRILRETPFTDLFIQPVANDAGTSLGAALLLHYRLNPEAERTFVWHHSYWGPQFDDREHLAALERSGLQHTRKENVAQYTAARIAAGNVVGWFQGRMEVGPRALGNRSLLADPRRPEMKELLNIRVKKREEFRPFAPSILEEAANEYFELHGALSPYMIMVGDVHPDKKAVIPAVTHVDGTARVHTVSKITNPRYWQLIDEFRKLTGVPVVLNTSFNENEPIVCTPEQAIECFRRTRIDTLVLGDHVVERAEAAARTAA
jgi:carbamoyltransferase